MICGMMTCKMNNLEIGWSLCSAHDVILCGWLGSKHQLTSQLTHSSHNSSHTNRWTAFPILPSFGSDSAAMRIYIGVIFFLIRITLHVLFSHLESVTMLPLFFAHCTGLLSPREQILSFRPCVSLSLMAQAQNTCLNCCTIYIPSRQLRSVSDTRLFRIPSFKTKTDKDLFHFKPLLSGTISLKLLDIPHLSPYFKSSLKTLLFSE